MKERAKTGLLWIATALLLGGCLLILYFSGFFSALGSEETIKTYIQNKAPWSHLTYFFLQFVSVIVSPIPSNMIALAGAMLFGTWVSFLLTFGAVLLGSVTMFFLARTLGYKFASQLVNRKLSDKYLDIIKRKRDIFLFLAFLFPFFPDDILCILAGLTDISFERFIVFAIVARPWGLLFACGLGGASFDIPIVYLIAIGILGVAVFVLTLIYGDKIEEKIIQKIDKIKSNKKS